ncbi:DUF6788 family protein [Ktedonobacter racemifer]|uniref:Transcriptional activator domain protein n=1 Tax=Ktedonobacter racemifer DSM 44963 TaxID=485913 RepID=D6THF8_KTERA|nr:DUF6788 family protein [Ktedonobacter racemifer]EFH88963.1 transcriptional activator domain protein [Ktedonobacter racemifer DSM 44963]
MSGKPSGKVTYRQQYTRCGKERCRKCREGVGHGPYWYAYWSEKGRTVSRYIGAILPPEIALELAHAKDAPLETPALPSSSDQSQAEPVLRVYLLGQYRIMRKQGDAWEPVESRTWHRKRARSLLGYLLSTPGRRMHREQIRYHLWPDLEAEIAANRLNGAVHELRQILEPDLERPATSRMLRLERDILELADSSRIWVDAEAFEQRVKEASAATNQDIALQWLEEAANLYAGSYLLEELYSEWATPRRDALQRTWVGMLLRLAQLYIAEEKPINAIEALDRLRTVEPTNEIALQRLMILLTHMDRRGEALQAYIQHVKLLENEYEGEPLSETTELYEALLKGQVPLLAESTPSAMPAVPASPTPGIPRPEAALQQEPAIMAHALHTLTATSTLHFTRPSFQLSRHNRSPLIGRGHEQEILRNVMHAITSAEPQLVFVETSPLPLAQTQPLRRVPHFLMLQGEAGIGKTRLAEELSLEAYTQGWTVAWSRSFEQEITIPYRPWIELLRTLLQSIPELAPIYADSPYHTLSPATSEPLKLSLRLEQLSTLLPELSQITHLTNPSPPPSAISLEQDRLHLWESTLHLLESLSQVAPLLLVLDDLHWADDSSLDLLTYLIHHFRQQHILVIATCRDKELTAQHKIRTMNADLCREQALVNLPVAPLSSDQIGTLVSYLPRDLVHTIQQQAAGNPFFAEELARFVAIPISKHALSGSPDALLKGTSLQPTLQQGIRGELASSALPEGISAVLERRLHRLSTNCRSLLNRAAVLGGSFELNLLLPMASEHSEDMILDLLDEALQAGLLTEEGNGAHITYHFWHPLIISHLYERLSAARRAQFHRRAVEAIKSANSMTPQEKLAADILYHLIRGGGETRQVSHYAELAGHHAYALAAYPEAQNFYRQVLYAIAYMPIHEAETEDIEHQIGHIASRTLEKAVEDPLRVCRVLERIAECNLVLGNYEIARACYDSMLSIRTDYSFMQRAYPSHMSQADQAYQEAQIRALLWRMIGYTWSSSGNYRLAQECFIRGRVVMQEAGIISGITWASLQSQYAALLRLLGHFEEALRLLQEALEILSAAIPLAGQRQHDDYWLPGIYQYSSSTSSEALQALRPQTRIERALSGDPVELGYVYERLGTVEICMGDTQESLRHLFQSLEIFEQAGLVSHQTVTCNNIGAVYMLRREHKEARKYLRRAVELAERIEELPIVALGLGNLGELSHQNGDLLEAEQLLLRCLATCEQVKNDDNLSWFTLEMAGIQIDKGDLDRARTYLLQALRISRGIKSTRNARYALLKLGELRLHQANAFHPGQPQPPSTPQQQRLLRQVSQTLQRAVTPQNQEEIECEMLLEGNFLLAKLHFVRGDLATATRLAHSILEQAQDNQIQTALERAYCLLGQIESMHQNYVQSDHYFAQALQLCQEHQLRLDYARTLASHGFSLLQRPSQPGLTQSTTEQALAALHQARDLFASSHATRDLFTIEHLLTSLEYTHL